MRADGYLLPVLDGANSDIFAPSSWFIADLLASSHRKTAAAGFRPYLPKSDPFRPSDDGVDRFVRVLFNSNEALSA